MARPMRLLPLSSMSRYGQGSEMFWLALLVVTAAVALIVQGVPSKYVPYLANMVAALPLVWDDLLALAQGVDYATMMTPEHASIMGTYLAGMNMWLKYYYGSESGVVT